MVDHSAAVRGVAAAFLALSSLAVILRCYVRLRIVKALGWDDWVMGFAMLFYIMFCGCMIGGSLWGTGKHLWDLTAKQRTIAMEYWFLCDISYAASSILAKISVCIFLLRVIPFQWHRATLYTVTALNVSTGIVFFVLLVIQCSPVSFWWRRMSGDTDGKCVYLDVIEAMLYAFSVTSAVFDLTVGLLPIILVHKLQMDRRTKAAVASILGMACIASIAIIIRIPFVPTIQDPDFLYATVQVAIWSAIEVGLSIAAGSLATTRPLFRVFFSRLSTSHTFTDDPSDPSSNINNNENKYRKSKSNSRRTSDRLALAALDSGLGSSVPASASASASAPTSASRTSNSIDKARGGSSGDGRKRSTFYKPYVGAQMMTLGSTADVEAGRGGDFGKSTASPGAWRKMLDFDGGERELSVPESAATSRSRIGLYQTFGVRSSGLK
ncbi:hypothetical protein BDW62DRAFT_101186 [Aspergillus aurantiobrunneus]